MKKTTKIVAVLVLLAAIVVLVKSKHIRKNAPLDVTSRNAGKPSSEKQVSREVDSNAVNAIPRLVDLGADKCIPCKMMAPILEELKKEYTGQMEVEFIDVWKNPDEAGKYGIRIIPTQIFFDSSGKELFRHEGFYSKQDILAKWKQLEVDLDSKR